MSPPPPQPLRPSLHEPADDLAGSRPELDDLEARYSAAMLDLWDARNCYLDQRERTGGHADDPMCDAWSAYEVARLRCTQLLLRIEAIEATAEASACARSGAGVTASPSGHHVRR